MTNPLRVKKRVYWQVLVGRSVAGLHILVLLFVKTYWKTPE